MECRHVRQRLRWRRKTKYWKECDVLCWSKHARLISNSWQCCTVAWSSISENETKETWCTSKTVTILEDIVAYKWLLLKLSKLCLLFKDSIRTLFPSLHKMTNTGHVNVKYWQCIQTIKKYIYSCVPEFPFDTINNIKTFG